MEIIICVLTALLGLCVGSFLNVVIYRVPNGMSIAMPPSHCPKCGYKLKWYDNIPVLSYIILGGKCRSCKEPISPRYTIVELLIMLLWLLGWKNLIVMVLVASLVGSVVLLILKFARKDESKKEYPFAPFIALGTVVAMLVGNYIVQWYITLCGIA